MGSAPPRPDTGRFASLQFPARVLFWAALAVVLVMTLLPSRMMPSIAFQFWDKAQHAIAFAGLAVLGFAAYARHWRRLVVGLVVLGGAIEVAQGLTGWRSPDFSDWIADSIGIALAFGALWLIRRIRTAASA